MIFKSQHWLKSYSKTGKVGCFSQERKKFLSWRNRLLCIVVEFRRGRICNQWNPNLVCKQEESIHQPETEVICKYIYLKYNFGTCEMTENKGKLSMQIENIKRLKGALGVCENLTNYQK